MIFRSFSKFSSANQVWKMTLSNLAGSEVLRNQFIGTYSLLIDNDVVWTGSTGLF
jgi:hypothetical protein